MFNDARTLVLTIRPARFEEGDLEVWASLYDGEEVASSTLLAMRMIPAEQLTHTEVAELLARFHIESDRIPRLL